MKRLFATFVSCLVLLSATVTTSALAEAKDEAEQSNVSVFQDALTTAADGIQSVLDGVKTSIEGLCATSEQLVSENCESAQASEPGASQDAENAAVIHSNISGVVWDTGYTTCTLQSGYSVDGQALTAEIRPYRDNITTFKAEANTKLTGNAGFLFQACWKLSSINFAASFDTSQVNNMNSMFAGCSSLTSLTLPAAFDTSSVENMSDMFYDCYNLETLMLPDVFNTRSVENMNRMFCGCTQLENINLSMCSSESLWYCQEMFADCENLRELNLGNLVPREGIDSVAMFADIDSETGYYSGSIPNIERITMSGACILEPGEGTSQYTASGSFFDYKEPLSWNAYYLGNAATEDTSAQSAQNNIFAEPTAVLTGFDEFKAYQETHPGLTTYVFDEQPTPPGPTPPGPTPDPTPDVVPATDTDVLPLTGDTSAPLASTVVAVLMGTVAFLACGYSLIRKRLQ